MIGIVVKINQKLLVYIPFFFFI